jgi:glutathione S-transferase
MLAAVGQPFTNVAITTADDLAALRASGRLPFDQMPLLEIDGLSLSQTTALIRYLARRGGLMPADPVEAAWADMVAGVAADLVEPAIQAAFQPTPAVVQSTLAERMTKFAPRLERRLAMRQTGWVAGEDLSFADVVLAEALTAHLELAPASLERYPLLDALRRRVTQQPRIAAYLTSPQRYPIADTAYVIEVAAVLRRALPAHMPDPHRFVMTT